MDNNINQYISIGIGALFVFALGWIASMPFQNSRKRTLQSKSYENGRAAGFQEGYLAHSQKRDSHGKFTKQTSGDASWPTTPPLN